MKKIMVVFGTRPEAIKMCPLIKEIKKRTGLELVVCVTGQHKEMLYQVLDVFDVVPEYDLNVMKKNQDLFDITSSILIKIKEILIKEKPDIVLLHGDTSTTFITSLACFYLHIPVGHVEAGLRTYNLDSPFPEEFNRQAVGLTAKLHFAPTEMAKQNLINEGKNSEYVYVTGNTAIDALATTIKSDYTHEELKWCSKSKMILLTAHRRENLGSNMENMFSAIRKIIDEYNDVKVIYPIHMNPIVRKCAIKHFSDCSRIHLIEPLDVIDFHNFMSKAHIILTDSGGIQEEAPSLGKPVLVMRDTTERPEGIEAGTLKLVGTNKANIYDEIKLLLDDEFEYNKMAKSSNPYGDGTASIKIVDVLENYFA